MQQYRLTESAQQHAPRSATWPMEDESSDDKQQVDHPAGNPGASGTPELMAWARGSHSREATHPSADPGPSGTPKLLTWARGGGPNCPSMGHPFPAALVTASAADDISDMSPEVLALREDERSRWLQSMRATSPEMVSEPSTPGGTHSEEDGMHLVDSCDESALGTPETHAREQHPACSAAASEERHRGFGGSPADDRMLVSTPLTPDGGPNCQRETPITTAEHGQSADMLSGGRTMQFAAASFSDVDHAAGAEQHNSSPATPSGDDSMQLADSGSESEDGATFQGLETAPSVSQDPLVAGVQSRMQPMPHHAASASSGGAAALDGGRLIPEQYLSSELVSEQHASLRQQTSISPQEAVAPAAEATIKGDDANAELLPHAHDGTFERGADASGIHGSEGLTVASRGGLEAIAEPATPGFSFHGSRAARVATPGR